MPSQRRGASNAKTPPSESKGPSSRCTTADSVLPSSELQKRLPQDGCKNIAEHINSKSLGVIVDIFQQLKDSEQEVTVDGMVRLRVQDDWLRSNTFPHGSAEKKESASRAETLESMVHSMKSASAALLAVQEVIRRKVRECEVQLKTLQAQGLASLPDEILVKIFRYAVIPVVKKHEKDHFPNAKREMIISQARMKLSHVCRRFMTVLAEHFCSTVASTMNSDLVTMTIDRTSKPSMEVYIGERDTTAAELKVFLDKTIPHSKNWKSLKMFDSIFTVEAQTTFALKTRNLRVPNLSSLVLYPMKKKLSQVCGEVDGYARTRTHYYSSWNAPNLRTLVADSMIPIPFVASKSLTTLTLSYHSIDDTPDSLAALCLFISSTSNLEVLSLFLACSFDLDPMRFDPRDWAGRGVVLRSLKTLNLTLKEWNDFFLFILLDALCFPNVTTLAVTTMFSKSEEMVPQLAMFARDLKNLRRFELDIQDSYECDDGITVIELAMFPTVEHITLNMHSVLFEVVGDSEEEDSGRLPALRTLEFRGCRLLGRDWVLSLLRRLKDRSISPIVTMKECFWYGDLYNYGRGSVLRKQDDLIEVDAEDVMKILSKFIDERAQRKFKSLQGHQVYELGTIR